MRRSRAVTILAKWLAPAAFAVAVAACAPGDEPVVATDLGLGDVVDESTADAGAAPQPVDDLALRAPDGSGVAAGTEEAPLPLPSPAPPTLAPGATVTTPPTSAPATTVAETAPPATDPPATSGPTTGPDPVPSGQPAPSDAPAPTAPAITADVAQLESGEVQSFTMLNDLRTGLGLDVVVRDPEMDAFAREWSRQMAESQRFEHSDGPYGENIAFTSNTQLTAAEAAELFHQLWVESPEHYGNMANERYTASGVGLYLTANGWYGTHVFRF